MNSPYPLETGLLAYIERAVEGLAVDQPAIDPGKRVRTIWPPEPVSHRFHVSARDFTQVESVEAYGEEFLVEIAETPIGFFGRCKSLWNEAKADSKEEMLKLLVVGMEPMLSRMAAIGAALELPGLVHQPVKFLSSMDLLKLLYCTDRDVAMEAQTVIESQASTEEFFPALLAVLRDRRHPIRRSPQWCVLDMFEDLPAFARTPQSVDEAVKAIRDLMWDAPDDYCRTIYKAGVVLGGHICTSSSAEAILEVIHSPSKIARRSAMHAVFHLNEWMPELNDRIVTTLEEAASVESEPLLAEFARHMAADIAAGNSEHVTEPVFPEEAVSC